MQGFVNAVGLILILPTVGFGQLIYPMEQTRQLQVSVRADEQDDTQSAEAADMTLWLHELDATLDIPDYYLLAGVGQYSDIGGTSLSAFGTADFSAVVCNYKPDARVEAGNSYRVRFAVAAPVTYDLSGSIATYVEAHDVLYSGWDIDSAVTVRLDQIAGPIVYEVNANAHVEDEGGPSVVSDAAPVASTGQLGPGVYELEIIATLDAPEMDTHSDPIELYGEATFVVDLAFTAVDPDPDCDRADIDEDGDVDLLDFSLLQQCFTGP